MLEQPPERSSLAVEAEAAALAQASMQFRPNGCVRVIVWCIPTILFYVTLVTIGVLLDAVGLAAKGALFGSMVLLVILSTNFGLGYFDALFCESVMVVSPDQRRKKILFHAARFTFWQFFFIPAITICMFMAMAAVGALLS